MWNARSISSVKPSLLSRALQCRTKSIVVRPMGAHLILSPPQSRTALVTRPTSCTTQVRENHNSPKNLSNWIIFLSSWVTIALGSADRIFCPLSSCQWRSPVSSSTCPNWELASRILPHPSINTLNSSNRIGASLCLSGPSYTVTFVALR